MNKIEEITNGYNEQILTYIDREGEHKININEFIKTGADNVLIKLNRTPDILLGIANKAPEKLKWVNDFAMAQVMKNLYEQIDDLQHSLIEKDTEIERLNNEAVASKVSIETQDSVSKEVADNLLNRNNELETDLELRQSQLNQVISEKEELEKQYKEISDRFTKSVAAYKELEEKFKSINTKIDEKNERIETLKNELSNVNNEYNSFMHESDKIVNELNAVGDEYNKLKETHATLEKEYENIKNSFSEATGQIRNLDSTNVELQQKVTEYNNLVAELQNTISSLNDEKTELQNTLEEKVKEISLMGAKIRNSEVDLEKVKRFETAVEEFLTKIGWTVEPNEHPVPVKDNAQHRMGDNQVVNFNLGQ